MPKPDPCTAANSSVIEPPLIAIHRFAHRICRFRDICDINATLGKFSHSVMLWNRLCAPNVEQGWQMRSLVMSISSSVPQSKFTNDDHAKIRNLVAECLNVDLELVSDEAHFLTDLGADWLDRLELMMVIEDQFGVEIADDAIDRMEAVGDLIRFIEDQRGH
jgi:acyl carrier protein